MKRIVGLSLIALVAVLLPVIAAGEATAQEQVFVTPAANEAASDIVNGRIISTTSVEVNGVMHRATEIEISSSVRGGISGSVLVETPGGERPDGTVVYVSHTPELVPGDLVQLALMPAEQQVSAVLPVATGRNVQVYSVAGGSDGAWGLLPDGVGAAEAVGDYTLSGAAWPDFPPAVSFKVNHRNSGVSKDGTIEAVQRAFQMWENDPGSTVDFAYAGDTTKTGLDLNDGANTVSWVTPPAGSGWLAQASWIATGDGDVIGFDIRVSRNYSWANGAATGKYDIGTVVGHEVGHGIGFGHTPASSELMYFQVSPGAIKPLGLGDRSGARFLYPDPDFGKIDEPGHSIDANADGDVAKLAMRGDGQLQIARNLGGGFSDWTTLGAGDWASADVSIAPDGTIYVAAVKNFGSLYTRRWRTNGWDEWVNHGGGWDSTTMPSISSNSATAFLGAIRANGELHTATGQSSWSGFTNHGATGWAHVDVDVATDGDLWWAAVKDDGRLYLRKNLGFGWSGFSNQGKATWSSTTAPAIAANSDGVAFAAIKNDGRLYTRRQAGGSWQAFKRHGIDSWASADITMSEGGTVWLAAHKSWGRLYTRGRTASGTWLKWATQGADTWSTYADASIRIGASGQPVLLAVKSSGMLYQRDRTYSGWGSWAGQGGSVWAVGK